MRIWKYFFTSNRAFKHKEFISNLHVCSNGLWKIWASYIFHLSIRILASTHKKLYNIFRITGGAISNIHFSPLYNIKMTCQTHMYLSSLENYYLLRSGVVNEGGIGTFLYNWKFWIFILVNHDVIGYILLIVSVRALVFLFSHGNDWETSVSF